jgi:hypothetical protein
VPDPLSVAEERRATVRALNAWSLARDGDEIPELSGLFDGSRQLGDREFLIKVDDDILDSVFIVFGSEIALPEGERGAGRSVSRVKDPALRDMFCEACAKSVSDRVAVCREGTIETASHAKAGYRCNFMPVRSGYEDTNMYVFGAFGIKAEPVGEPHVA